MNFLPLQTVLVILHNLLTLSIVSAGCPPLLPKENQYLRVICYETLDCDKPGSSIPAGGRALVQCKSNYESELNDRVLFTCLTNKKWAGTTDIDVNEMSCKSKCGKQNVGKIDGGSEQPILRWPWEVGIFLNGSHHCDGSIINPIPRVYLVITTIDCVTQPDGTPRDIREIKIGIGFSLTSTTDFNISSKIGGAQLLKIKNVLMKEDGIALILTEDRIQLSEYAQPICLPKNNVFEKTNLTRDPLEAVGFGRFLVNETFEQIGLISQSIASLSGCATVSSKLLDLRTRKYCANMKTQFDCKCGGGHSVVSKIGNPTRYTLQGIVGSGLTNYTCADIMTVEPVFNSVQWIFEIATKIAKEMDITSDVESFSNSIKNGDRVTSSATDIIYYVAVCVIIVGLGAFALSFRSYCRDKKVFTQEEMDDFYKGALKADFSNTLFPEVEMSYECIPYDTSYEIIESEFMLDESNILGSGAYGIVFKGSYKSVPVAVKTVKELADKSYFFALLSELKVLMHLGKHPHLVSLVGAQTKYLQRGVLYILVELCPLGNLSHYLNNNRKFYSDEMDDGLEPMDNIGSYQNIQKLSRKNLIQWSLEISCAMEYLEDKKIIHGDLAARNVLLTDELSVKVSDFGLSRKLYEYTIYIKKHQEPLPWRWMALESVQKMEFSTKSDVWAFGITLWEIFSLGDVPYPGMSYTMDFPLKLGEGLRLYTPMRATEQIFNTMQDCWHHNPDDRPSFKSITAKLRNEINGLRNRPSSDLKLDLGNRYTLLE